ncbi:MAG: C-terminal glycine zipper region [Acidobacteriota bacterium]|nr:C-terminal glycine zipper region [Acidobacteriota bacterium]
MDENTNPTGPAAAGSGTDKDDSGDASGRFGRAKDYADEKYRAASGAVRDGYNSVRERVDDVDFGAITDQVRTYVRSNPGKALLISVGVGFVVGLLLRRNEDED